MRLHTGILAIIITMSGCFATMPDPVKDEYLKNASQTQMNNIYEIDDTIIAINKEKDKYKKKHKITKREIEVSKKTIKMLKSQESQIEEKLKLYKEMEDPEKIEAGEKELADNTRKLENEKIKLDYLEHKEDYQDALIELKHAELSYNLAKREYERAKIARAYQDTLPEAQTKEEKEKRKDENVDLKKYKDYHDSQKKNYTKRQDKKNAAAEKLGQAELRLNDIKK